MKPIRAAAAAVVLALFLTGCNARAQVLHDTDTLHIERTGVTYTINDLAGGESYTFTLRRVRHDSTQGMEIRTPVDTDTLNVQTVGALIVVTDKTAGEVVYIRKGRVAT